MLFWYREEKGNTINLLLMQSLLEILAIRLDMLLSDNFLFLTPQRYLDGWQKARNESYVFFAWAFRTEGSAPVSKWKGGLKTCNACHSFYYPIGSENPHAFFMPLLWTDAPGWVRLPKEAEAQVVSQSKRTERKIQKFSSMAEEKD